VCLESQFVIKILKKNSERGYKALLRNDIAMKTPLKKEFNPFKIEIMKHKKSIILFALFLFWGLAGAIGQSNTLPSGGEATGSGGTLSFSIGQVDYIQAEGSGGTASQGVQQPFEIFVLGIDTHPEILLDIKVFPNPTISNVTLRIGNFEGGELSYQLYDIHGRLLTGQSLQTDTTNIPMEDLASAVYLLQVIDKSGPIKTFKIIKN